MSTCWISINWLKMLGTTVKTICYSNISVLMTLLLEEWRQVVRAPSNKVKLLSPSVFRKSNFHLFFYYSFSLSLSLRRAVIFWNAVFDFLWLFHLICTRGCTIWSNWERWILSLVLSLRGFRSVSERVLIRNAFSFLKEEFRLFVDNVFTWNNLGLASAF
jgi:hypothetical protein